MHIYEHTHRLLSYLSVRNASPPPPQQNIDPPQTRFRDQLQRLEEMGFHDQALNIRALFAAGGDVTSAIDWLLQNLN